MALIPVSSLSYKPVAMLIKHMCWLVLALLCINSAAAQDVLSENRAKAALLYNFMKKTQWPDENGIEQFRVVFVGDQSHFFSEFESIAREVSIRGKAVKVTQLSDYTASSQQQVLVVSPNLNDQLDRIATAFVRTGTLLISDGASDKKSVMINYTYPKAEHLSFEVNKSNIIYDGLTISNDVMLHGGSEIEIATLYKEMEFSLQKIKDEVEQHKRELKQSKQSIQQKNLDLKKQSSQIRAQSSRISTVAELLNQKSNQLNAQTEKLKEIDRELHQNKASLTSSKQLLEQRAQEVVGLGIQIAQKLSVLQQQEKDIEQQREEIMQQQSLIDQQSEKVVDQEATISSQRNVIIIVLVLLLAFTVYIILRQKQALARERKLLQAEEELVKAQSESIKAYESSLKVKNDFLTAVNHEMRTPMNGILGALQVVDSDDMESLRSSMEIVSNSASEMMELIDDVLTYSEIQSEQIQDRRETVCIQKLFDAMYQHYSVLCEDKGLRLNWQVSNELPVYLELDRENFTKALAKLFHNAIKFTEEGSISFTVDCVTNDTGRRIICNLEDTGKGIAEDEQKHLFEAFWQRESGVGRQYGGLGIGLAISQKLIHSMGGEIEVQSIESGGCKVVVSLAAVEARPVVESPQSSVAVENWLPILVVEDNLVNQKILQKMLKKLGYDSIVANDGEEALVTLKKENPSLVLMDVQMPKMDGITCTREIRKGGGLNGNVPIIAVTANLLDSQQENCIEAGMNGYLGKPVKLSVLKMTLAKYVPLEKDASCA